MNDDRSTTLPCPRCGAHVKWNDEAHWKPFCSERCKLIDLGAWFAEEHSIPGEPTGPEAGSDRKNPEDSP